MSFTLTSGSFPTPLGPSPTSIGNGSSGPFSSGMTTGVSQLLNQQSSARAILGGGGTYAVVYGLSLSSPSGLNIAVAAGVGVMNDQLELVASGNYGPLQAVIPTPLTLPASSTSYVWLTASGTLVSSTSLTPPTGGLLFLGTVTTSGSAVTTIDYSGVVYMQDGDRIRYTADAWAPNDAPSSGVRFFTETATGMYFWDGVSHKLMVDLTKQLPTPWRFQTLTADYQILVNDPNLIYLNPGTAARNVTFENPASVTPGHNRTIVNPTGSGYNLTVKAYGGGSTVATLTPGQQITYAPIVDHTGAQTFPSTITPVAQATVSEA